MPGASAPRTGVAGGGSAPAEAFRGLLCGLAFGLTSPLVAHPLDTLKSRMQALPALAGAGALRSLRQTLAEGGWRALYRGLLPPLLGSVLYRSVQFSAYSAAYAACRDSRALTAELPALGGLQPRVLLAGAVATSARALIETPLEVIKVRRMLGVAVLPGGLAAAALSAPLLRELYTGFALTWLRLYVALGGFFILVDHADRHHPGLFTSTPAGPFLKGAVCATLPWLAAWPLEVAKSQAQSTLHGARALGVLARLRGIVRERGVRGLYRGAGPGLSRSLIGNGAALAAYDMCRSRLGA